METRRFLLFSLSPCPLVPLSLPLLIYAPLWLCGKLGILLAIRPQRQRIIGKGSLLFCRDLRAQYGRSR